MKLLLRGNLSVWVPKDFKSALLAMFSLGHNCVVSFSQGPKQEVPVNHVLPSKAAKGMPKSRSVLSLLNDSIVLGHLFLSSVSLGL